MTVDLIELDARAMAAYGNTFRARVRRELKRAPEGRTCDAIFGDSGYYGK